jgi:hypothetical protein
MKDYLQSICMSTIHSANNRLTTVFDVIGSENISQPKKANIATPMAKPKSLDSHKVPLKAIMK